MMKEERETEKATPATNTRTWIVEVPSISHESCNFRTKVLAYNFLARDFANRSLRGVLKAPRVFKRVRQKCTAQRHDAHAEVTFRSCGWHRETPLCRTLSLAQEKKEFATFLFHSS
jgi:hypothetical protein